MRLSRETSPINDPVQIRPGKKATRNALLSATKNFLHPRASFISSSNPPQLNAVASHRLRRPHRSFICVA